jgi:hypothetical protein
MRSIRVAVTPHGSRVVPLRGSPGMTKEESAFNYVMNISARSTSK